MRLVIWSREESFEIIVETESLLLVSCEEILLDSLFLKYVQLYLDFVLIRTCYKDTSVILR